MDSLAVDINYGQLAPLMADIEIEEIWINSPSRIFIAQIGRAHV